MCHHCDGQILSNNFEKRRWRATFVALADCKSFTDCKDSEQSEPCKIFTLWIFARHCSRHNPHTQYKLTLCFPNCLSNPKMFSKFLAGRQFLDRDKLFTYECLLLTICENESGHLFMHSGQRGGVARCTMQVAPGKQWLSLVVRRLVLSGSFDFGWGAPKSLWQLSTPVSPPHQLHVKAALRARRDPYLFTTLRNNLVVQSYFSSSQLWSTNPARHLHDL